MNCEELLLDNLRDVKSKQVEAISALPKITDYTEKAKRHVDSKRYKAC